MTKHESSAPPAPAPAPAPIRTFRTRSGTIRAQRATERKELDLAVEFIVDGGAPIPGVATNLGIGGAFVHTASPAQFGASVILVIRLPDGMGTASIPSTVRWCKTDGMGIQFASMGARETHGLTELLKPEPAKPEPAKPGT